MVSFFYGTQVKSRQLGTNYIRCHFLNCIGKSLNSIVNLISQCFWLTSDARQLQF